MEGYISLIIGIIFLIIAFVDVKLFKFHPLQKNVLIDYNNSEDWEHDVNFSEGLMSWNLPTKQQVSLS